MVPIFYRKRADSIENGDVEVLRMGRTGGMGISGCSGLL